MKFIDQYFTEAKKIIDKIDRNQILKMISIINETRSKDGRMFILGVGGGAGHASHAVNDFSKICGIEAYTPTDNVSELNTFVGSHMINKGEAEAIICGTNGRYHEHFKILKESLGLMTGINQAAAVNVIMVKKGVYFICDTAVTIDPTAEQIAENTLLAAETVKRFGINSRVALL